MILFWDNEPGPKILIIKNSTGSPGAGKSTSAQLLSRNSGFVYYEADCYAGFVNPFIDPNADEPSLQQGKQKPLKVRISKNNIFSIHN